MSNEDSVELPELNPNQLAYVRYRLEGKAKGESYILAFSDGSMTKDVAWAAAARLESKPYIKEWMDHAKSTEAMNSVCTHKDHLAQLARLSAAAESKGNYGAAVQAEISRGKACGFYIEKTLDLTPQISDEELLGFIRELLGDEVADKALETLGLSESVH